MKTEQHNYLPTDCKYCREHNYPPEGMTGQCEYCGNIYCFSHMNPDSHNCNYRIKRSKEE